MKLYQFMRDLFLYTFSALALKNLFQDLSKFFSVGVLDSETVLKIRYKLFLFYFDIKKIVGVSSELEEFVKKPGEGEDLAGSMFVLKAMKISVKSFNGATKVWFL